MLKHVIRVSLEPTSSDFKNSCDNIEDLRKRAENDRKKRLIADKEKKRLKRVYEKTVSHEWPGKFFTREFQYQITG